MSLAQCRGRFLLLGAVLLGCGGTGKVQLEPLLSWSLEEMGEVEPQIRRQFERALAHLESRLQRGVDDSELAQAVGDLAILHHVYQNTEQALLAYELSEQLDQSDPRWPYYRGYLLASQDQVPGAIEGYNGALEIQADLVPVRIRLAEAQTEVGDLQGAADSYAALDEGARGTARVLAGRAELALASENFEEAADLFRRATELRPESNRVRLGLGQALRESGRIDEARAVFAEAGAITPQDAELGFADPLLANLYANDISSQRLWELGQGHLQAGRGEEALELFRKAAEIIPNRDSYATDIGNALALTDELEAAILQFEGVLARSPDYLPALAGLAKAQSRLGNRSAAGGTYRRLLDLSDGHPEVHVELANLYRVSGERAAAESHYRRALELDPQSASAYVWLAWLQFEEGHAQASLDLIRQGLRYQPDHAWLASLEMRLRARELGEEAVSERLLEAAVLLKANPTAFNAETLAMVLAGRGDFESAWQWQNSVIAAAVDLGLDDGLMTSRLESYEKELPPKDVLARADFDAARLPLRRADFERLAPTLPKSAR